MQYNYVPLIPGMMSTHYQDTSKADFRKRQILEQMSVGKASGFVTAKDILTTKLNQICGASAPHEQTFYDPSGGTSGANLTGNSSMNQCTRFRKSSNNNMGATSTKYRVDMTQPKWITNDRQVLRFYGYFQEKVQENGYDALRTRRVVLCFYLSDTAISISEPRIENSGIAQGEFMKRMCVTKPNGTSFTPDDFRIGKEVRLYGRVFHIVDSDEATRTFYEEAMDTPLDSPRKYPDDYSSQVDEIEAIKAKLRAKTTAIAESKTEVMRKFHENSQKVLRFYVSWQDPHPLYPETRKYILHYYLCDDTIEIVEPKEERVGRGHFAVLLSRRKVMKHDKMQQATLLEHPKGRLLMDRDLRCGEHVSIFSRQFLLEDCDPFTRDYYLEIHGVTQEPCEAASIGTNSKPSRWKLLQQAVSQQSNGHKSTGGFSSAMLQRLDAHVQDSQEKTSKFHRSDALDNKQLRFRARFHGLRKEDMNYHREFTVTYFLEDDTLSVFEPRVKNAGVTGGRFLDRGRFRKCMDATNRDTMSRENQKERSAYCASDFYVGAIVRFEFSPNQRLELIEADEQTLSYCESHPDVFLYSNIRAIVQQIAISLDRNGADIRRECRTLDQRRQRVISTDDLKRVLHKINLYPELNAQQLVTISRRYSQQHGDAGRQDTRNHDDVMIAYDEFCDDLVLTIAKLDEQRNGGHSDHGDGWYTKLTKIPNLRNALQRACDPKNADLVPGDVFLQMMRFYHVNMLANDIEELMINFSRNGGVEYQKLCDRVFQSPSSSFAANRELLKQPQQYQQRHSGFDDFHEDDAAQFCEPPTPVAPRSPRKASPQIPTLKLPALSNTLSRPSAIGVSDSSSSSSSSKRSDPRVVELLQRVFGSRKYQLRKALRERDTEKSGSLGEEEFMDAILSVEPKLSDDDTYLIADAYFPTNNCQLDYPKLLENAFRT